jgi:hypothetical protein
VNNVLSKVAKANGIEVVENTKPSLMESSKKSILILVSAIFLLLQVRTLYGFLMQVGVDQDYVNSANSLFT